MVDYRDYVLNFLDKRGHTPKNAKDLTGKIFGNLTAIEKISHKDPYFIRNKNDSSATWKCICSCGSMHYTKASYLRKGAVQSCGCIRDALNKKLGKRRGLPNKASAKRKLLYTYKKAAENRKIRFELTPEEFFNICSKPCNYCGSNPCSITTTSRDNDEAFTLIHNGVDRVDNTVGYISDNCVSCCAQCNWFKGQLTLNQFLDHIKKIYEFKNLSN